MGSVGASFFKDACSQIKPAAAKRCGKCRQCIFMESRCQSSYNILNLPVGSQSFRFAKTSFFRLSSTLAKAQPRDPARSMTTQAGKEDSERQKRAG